MIEIGNHDPDWAGIAAAEIARWKLRLGRALVEVHHIGSTAVPGLAARPVIDLLPEFAEPMDLHRAAAADLGYDWLGEHGLAGRRYCRRDDPGTGRRLFLAHCYLTEDPSVARHIAFRDALRSDPLLASAYESRKRHCASLHPDDPIAYGACKAPWIDTVEARALETRR